MTDPYRGPADVIDDLDPETRQGSLGGITHQVRGEYGFRRCDEPSYTITGTQYPYLVPDSFQPDPSYHGVGDIEVAEMTDREFVKAVQTISEIDVQTERKGEALSLIGNAVPAELAESVVSEVIGND